MGIFDFLKASKNNNSLFDQELQKIIDQFELVLKSKIDFYNNKTLTFYKYSCLLTLGLIRPQSIFVYLRPIYSLGFFLLFICYFMVRFLYDQINIFVKLFHEILKFLPPFEISFYQFIKITNKTVRKI